MAIQVFDEPGLGTRLGTSLGGGVSKGINRIIEDKLKEVQAQRLQTGGLPGVLAYLDPAAQAAHLRGYSAAQKLAGEQEAGSDIEREIQKKMSSEYAGEPTEEQKQFADAYYPDAQMTKKEESPSEVAERIPEQINKELISREKQLGQELRLLKEESGKEGISPQKSHILSKRIEEKEKILDKIRDQNFTANQKIMDEVTKNAEDADELISAIKRQQKLNEKGELSTPGTLAMLEGMGINIEALKTNDTQEFIKNNGPFLKNLKKLFGGKVTDAELKQYMSTIANEYQTPEGRRRILLGMERTASIAKAKFSSMDSIIRQNDGIPPRDLNIKMLKHSKKEVDRLTKEWKKSLKRKPLPPLESRFVTGAKALAGKAMGSLGSVIKRAGPGALLGAGIGAAGGGGFGAVPGALGGGLLGLLGLLGGTK